jgi:hypothetical protein
MSNRSNDYIYAVRDTKGVSPYNAPRARKIFPKTPQKKTTIHLIPRSVHVLIFQDALLMHTTPLI